MDGEEPRVSADVGTETEETAEPDFDHLTGIVTDGLIGAVGGLVGTGALTVGLLIASSLGAFELKSFATLAELTGLNVLFESNPAAVGYVLFLLTGMVMWPLLFASIGSYLPGEKFATKGIPYGFVLWTGFAPAFYEGYTGLALGLYLVLTLGAHFSYGFTLGAVFDYLGNRPETLV
ncbi:hypothetical protein NGM10_17185 (plasmid) [Halorussus salilacus]|uniref:DUF6789 family protein n=1 Tax=Halorussus salilacus TaxID=2953750 RepID=UPI00209FDFA3|nr:DUF6789 family protein [Halorussus salilacus]USZ69830.1 hypothetical protein NGM10_17185 [Halorussus salilacus]